ncbi:MAG: FIST N-terminal domain-containing protein, partial [Verrucomicrobiota bacterium]
MNSEHSVADHWSGGFDEAGLQRWAEQLRRKLSTPRIDLGLVFMSPKYFPHAKQVLDILRVHAQIPLLAGCSSQGLIVERREVEEGAGITLGLYALPGSTLKAVHFTQEQVEEANGAGYWRLETGVETNQTNGWLAFIDPFHLDSESWLRTWN